MAPYFTFKAKQVLWIKGSFSAAVTFQLCVHCCISRPPLQKGFLGGERGGDLMRRYLIVACWKELLYQAPTAFSQESWICALFGLNHISEQPIRVISEKRFSLQPEVIDLCSSCSKVTRIQLGFSPFLKQPRQHLQQRQEKAAVNAGINKQPLISSMECKRCKAIFMDWPFKAKRRASRKVSPYTTQTFFALCCFLAAGSPGLTALSSARCLTQDTLQ